MVAAIPSRRKPTNKILYKQKKRMYPASFGTIFFRIAEEIRRTANSAKAEGQVSLRS